MKIVKILVGIVVSIIALVVIIGLILPSGYQMKRSIVINAPVEKIFEQVNDLPKNANWNPWSLKDKTMKWTFGEIKAGKGASYSWTSQDSGEGKLTITESTPPSSLKTQIDFGEMGKSQGHWTFKPGEKGVTVTWGFSGDNGMNPIGRIFGAMMDSMVGPYFELGLAKLKEIAEATPAP